jgi:hypothetical protein
MTTVKILSDEARKVLRSAKRGLKIPTHHAAAPLIRAMLDGGLIAVGRRDRGGLTLVLTDQGRKTLAADALGVAKIRLAQREKNCAQRRAREQNANEAIAEYFRALVVGNDTAAHLERIERWRQQKAEKAAERRSRWARSTVVTLKLRDKQQVERPRSIRRDPDGPIIAEMLFAVWLAERTPSPDVAAKEALASRGTEPTKADINRLHKKFVRWTEILSSGADAEHDLIEDLRWLASSALAHTQET